MAGEGDCRRIAASVTGKGLLVLAKRGTHNYWGPLLSDVDFLVVVVGPSSDFWFVYIRFYP